MKAPQLTSIFLFILLIFSIHKIIGLKTSNELYKVDVTNTIESKDKELTDALERLTIYYLITLEQNEIIEANRSSRNLKANNIKLNNLMQKL
jgi:hypothetical protein